MPGTYIGIGSSLKALSIFIYAIIIPLIALPENVMALLIAINLVEHSRNAIVDIEFYSV